MCLGLRRRKRKDSQGNKATMVTMMARKKRIYQPRKKAGMPEALKWSSIVASNALTIKQRPSTTKEFTWNNSTLFQKPLLRCFRTCQSLAIMTRSINWAASRFIFALSVQKRNVINRVASPFSRKWLPNDSPGSERSQIKLSFLLFVMEIVKNCKSVNQISWLRTQYRDHGSFPIPIPVKYQRIVLFWAGLRKNFSNMRESLMSK
mmetsp:Transcript_60523/g.69054  ORF Transcript_60523/g.69054 Transcript_60523/m.69054 type:complete len:205 (-) Transcript_60523:58-672(-)